MKQENIMKRIKNWAIIQGVRIKKFVFDHKYVSATIGLLLISAIIAVVVFASEDDIYEGKIKVTSNGNISVTSTDSDNPREVKSFSTVVYNIPIKINPTEDISSDSNEINSRTIKLTAEVDNGLDVSFSASDNSDFEYDANGRFVLYDYALVNNSVDFNFYMMVYNVSNDTVVAPKITVCEKTSGTPGESEENCYVLTGDTEGENSTKVTVKSTKAELIAKSYAGSKYTLDDNNTYMPFGILVGIDLSKYSNSLSGLYFDNNFSIKDLGVESGKNSLEKDTTMSLTDKYGVFYNDTKDINILGSEDFPRDSKKSMNISNSYVYNSGNAVLEGNTLNISGITTRGSYATYNSEGYVYDYIYNDIADAYGKNLIDSLRPKKNGNFIVFGSYYITTNIGNTENSKIFRLTGTLKDKQIDSYIGVNSGSNDSTITNNSIRKTNVSIKKADDLTKTVDTLAYGEEFILEVRSTYNSIDSDSDYSLSGNISFTQGADSPASFIYTAYNESAEENKGYYLEYNSKAQSLDEMRIILTDGTDDISLKTLEDYNSYYNKSIKSLKYDTVKQSSSDGETKEIIKNGQEVIFRTKFKITSVSGSGKININVTNTYNGITTSNGSTSINVTPYKARVSASIDGGGSETRVNLDSKTSSTITIYPKVELPLTLISTNPVDYNSVDMEITVSLPEHVNYRANNNYLAPKSVNGKTIVYELNGAKLNEWISPIYLDVDYDIETPANIEELVQVQISKDNTTTDSNITDISTFDNKSSSVKITFLSSKDITYTINPNTNTISKGGSFEIIANIYNRKSTEELYLIAAFPTDETGQIKASASLPNTQGMLCTTDNQPSVNNNIYKDCTTDYEDDVLVDTESGLPITAIKTKITFDNTNHYKFSGLKFNTSADSGYTNYDTNVYIVNDSEVKNTIPIKVSVENYKITGNVWIDFNEDGILSDDEKKAESIEMELYDSENNLLYPSSEGDETRARFNYSKGVYTFEIYDSVPTSYYVVAKYNENRYSLSPTLVGSRNVSSSFRLEDGVARTDEITFRNNRIADYINLGLMLKKNYKVKLNKYISSITTTNALGISNVKEYGKTSFAKLDIRDIDNMKIKVTYSIEIQNSGTYPGYVYRVIDMLPDGMTFNDSYEENKDWILNDDGTLENTSLSGTIIQEGEKKYLTLSLDISRKEAGTFVNYVSISDEDLGIVSLSEIKDIDQIEKDDEVNDDSDNIYDDGNDSDDEDY